VEWNRDTRLVLLIAFGMQRKKRHALIQRELLQRAGERIERRRLEVPSVKAPQNPAEARHADGGSHARIDSVLLKQAGIVRKAKAAVQRKPGCDPVLVLQNAASILPEGL